MRDDIGRNGKRSKYNSFTIIIIALSFAVAIGIFALMFSGKMKNSHEPIKTDPPQRSLLQRVPNPIKPSE